MTNWERQTEHRLNLERIVVTAQATAQVRGQRYAAVIGVAGLLASGAAAVSGHEASAIALAGIDFGGLAGVFIFNKYREGKDLEAKAEQVPDPSSDRPRRKQAELPKGRPTPQQPRKKRGRGKR